MDPLSAIFADLRLRARVNGVSHLSPPWTIQLPSASDASRVPNIAANLPGQRLKADARFHLVVAGRCWLSIDHESSIELRTGDLAITIQPSTYIIRHAPADLSISPLPTLADTNEDGRNTDDLTSVIDGELFFDSLDADKLLPALPRVIHLSADSEAQHWLPHLTTMFLRELRELSTGGQAIIDSLAGVLFIQGIRHYLGTLPTTHADADRNWATALLDPEIGGAIARIHRAPHAPWSVASLADDVLMSRSAFAAKFTRLVGKPPMGYVSAFRMQRAFELIRSGSAVKDVAKHIGYDSDAAFSSAFKRRFGMAPRDARAMQPNPPDLENACTDDEASQSAHAEMR